ncbi:FAD dependent oxidoreductase [Aspergillus spinulosporus]
MELYRFLAGLLSSLPTQLVPLSLGRLATHSNLFSPATVQQAPKPPAEGTVILGAGVIGLSTAYYLALALNETTTPKPPIVVIEPSHDVCPAASGEATGGLGDFGFSVQTSPLGSLSYSLHQALAAAYGGTEQYGFSDLAIYRLSPEGFKGNYSPPDSWGPSAPVRKSPGDLPPWVRVQPDEDWAVHLMAEAPHAAHLDPRRFCHFLRDRCKELGVQFRFNSHVTSLTRSATSESFTSVTVQQTTSGLEPSREDTTSTTESKATKSTRKTEVLPCNALIIASGPWTPRVFSALFPRSPLKLRMNKNSTRSAGNHLLIRNPHRKHGDDNRGVTQVFFNNVLPNATPLDITSFLGGYLYLGGWGAVPQELPGEADEVEPQPEEIEAMVKVARRVLCLGPEGVEVVSAGRCYRPLAEPNRPIITRVPWGLLGEEEKAGKGNGYGGATPVEGGGRGEAEHQISVSDSPASPVVGGLYINTAHNSDGVTLGPGSGKLMSELLLGRETSVPAGEFGLESERLERL